VPFGDLANASGTSKAGYAKLQICGKQVKKDGLNYFWAKKCCINKGNQAELFETIASMFRRYRDAEHCYVYLSDVSTSNRNNQSQQMCRQLLKQQVVHTGPEASRTHFSVISQILFARRVLGWQRDV